MKHNFNYCERNSLEFFAEPLNAVTNILFIVVSAFLLFRYKNKEKPFLALIIFMIGISSFLYHTIPIGIWGALDVFFILLYILFYLSFAINKFFILSRIISIFISIAFLFICYFFGNFFKNTIIGTTSYYLPIVFALYILYFLFKKKVAIKKEYFFYSAVIFSISVMFRALDYYLCSFLHIGTHFIWHILNALTLYFLGKFYYLNSTDPPQKNHPSPK